MYIKLNFSAFCILNKFGKFNRFLPDWATSYEILTMDMPTATGGQA